MKYYSETEVNKILKDQRKRIADIVSQNVRSNYLHKEILKMELPTLSIYKSKNS